jgi:tetratricopeptide (TPR) repeat protein
MKSVEPAAVIPVLVLLVSPLVGCGTVTFRILQSRQGDLQVQGRKSARIVVAYGGGEETVRTKAGQLLKTFAVEYPGDLEADATPLVAAALRDEKLAVGDRNDEVTIKTTVSVRQSVLQSLSDGRGLGIFSFGDGLRKERECPRDHLGKRTAWTSATEGALTIRLSLEASDRAGASLGRKEMSVTKKGSSKLNRNQWSCTPRAGIWPYDIPWVELKTEALAALKRLVAAAFRARREVVEVSLFKNGALKANASGLRQFEAKDYEAAVKSFRAALHEATALRDDSLKARAYHNLGVALTEAYVLEEAQRALQSAQQLEFHRLTASAQLRLEKQMADYKKQMAEAEM